MRPLLHGALAALDQAPPAELRQAPVAEQLAWAIDHWQVAQLRAEPHRTQGADAALPD